ncbi:hypothetical protein ACMD2_24656, partial [Ananas comosus]
MGNVSNPFIDILQEAPLSGHRQPRSILGGVLYCLLLASYAVVAAAAPWIFFLIPNLIPMLLCSILSDRQFFPPLFNLLKHLYSIDMPIQYWVYQVRKVRLQGYYSFSQRLMHSARLPFAIIAYGTALMLLVLVWQPYIRILSITILLRTIMVVEAVCAGCFMGCIYKYNALNGQPDVLKSLYSALQPSSSLEDLRYYDGGHLSDQQMALLQYQRENLHYLSEEVLRLQESLSKYQRTDDGSTPQMNQVQSELRLARSLIAEKDSEIQRITGTNNQYVEENERLRAILGEWSARAAK